MTGPAPLPQTGAKSSPLGTLMHIASTRRLFALFQIGSLPALSALTACEADKPPANESANETGSPQHESTAPVPTIESPLAAGVYRADEPIPFRGSVADAEDDAGTLTAWWEEGGARLRGNVGDRSGAQLVGLPTERTATSEPASSAAGASPS